MTTLTTSWQKLAEGSATTGSSSVNAINRLYLRYDGRDTANNKDTIYWEIRAVASAYSYGYGYDENYSIKDGSTTKASGTYREGSWPSDPVTTSERVLASGSWTQYHNSDGNWSTTLTFNGCVYGSSYTKYVDISLPMIPRQANLTSAQDFNDEGNPTITYSNSAGNSVSGLVAGIFDTAGSVSYASYRNVNKTGTLSYTFNLTSAERTALRQACTGNSMAVKFYLRTYIGGTYYYSSIQKTMTIVNGNPTFSNFTFADTNSTTIDLTGNNQNVIKGYSNVTATVSTANKAIANKEASMSKYRFSCGTNSSVDFNYSNSSDVSGTINSVSDGIFTLYAIDSRGNSKSVVKQANSIIDYADITKGSISATRSNGISKETTLAFSGTWWNNNFRDGLVKSLGVGDVLSNTSLVLDFSSLTYADVYSAGIPGYQVLAKSDNGYQIELSILEDARLGNQASVEMIYVENDTRNYIDTLWLAYDDETVETNLTTYDLSSGFGTPIFDRPANFGTLTQVNSTSLVYSMIKYQNSRNNALEVSYKYKKASDSNYTTGTTGLSLTINNNNYSFSGLIAGDEGNEGFNINYSYDIQVIVTDELSSVTFTVQLSSGIPHIAYAQDGVGIMGKYDETAGGLLQIAGKPVFESGSNAYGSWIKYADGTLICHKRANFGTQAFNNTWGNLYETNKLNLGDYPVPFVGDYPDFYIMPWHAMFAERSYSASLTSWGGFWAVRPVSGNADVMVSCFAIGRWK